MKSSTRERVAALLLEEGPATAAALAQRLQLSPAGVRRHLDAMVATGELQAQCPPRRPWQEHGAGRPARVYALTPAAHARAPHAYDDLATDALAFIAHDEAALDAFVASRTRGITERYAGVAGDRPGIEELAGALTADGYAATVHSTTAGTQICQHHCPVAAVAERFPQLCEAETAALESLLGTHVQRLATIAHGDGVCTTHIPAARPAHHRTAGPPPAGPGTTRTHPAVSMSSKGSS